MLSPSRRSYFAPGFTLFRISQCLTVSHSVKGRGKPLEWRCSRFVLCLSMVTVSVKMQASSGIRIREDANCKCRCMEASCSREMPCMHQPCHETHVEKSSFQTKVRIAASQCQSSQSLCQHGLLQCHVTGLIWIGYHPALLSCFCSFCVMRTMHFRSCWKLPCTPNILRTYSSSPFEMGSKKNLSSEVSPLVTLLWWVPTFKRRKTHFCSRT